MFDSKVDLSVLQDFKLNTTDTFTNWEFDHQEYQDIPLSFFNRFNKNYKYADLSSIPPSKQDAQFMVIEGNIKKKAPKTISKNYKLTDRKQPGNIKNTRIFSKRETRLRRWYETVTKTKFKQITVKNEWQLKETINKVKLDSKAKSIKAKIQHIKSCGKARYMNPDVERISWTPVGFTENKVFQVESASTSKDSFLQKISMHYFNSEEKSDKVRIVCSPEFLLAIMSVRGSVYPWAISIQKYGNLIVLDNFNENEETDKLTYLDLFTTNENTNNSMANDENKIKEFCTVATRMTKVFQELLVTDKVADYQTEEEHNPYDNNDDQEDEEKQEEKIPNKLVKYIKISLGKFEIFTKVRVDGVKENHEGYIEEYLIRTFLETETQGAWMKDMNVSGGNIITKQYQFNNCSLQKWIFEAKLAGVEKLKLGFIGYNNKNKNKPVLLNVHEATVQNLEKTLSVKMEECWGNVKYLLDLVGDMDTGTYLLSKSPYTPLSLKFFMISGKEDFEDEEEEEEDAQLQQEQEKAEKQEEEEEMVQKTQ